MSSRARRFGGALSVLALLALGGAALALADSGSTPPWQVTGTITTQKKMGSVGQSTPAASAPKATHVAGYRLTAKLTGVNGSTASGRWDGVLVQTRGAVTTGTLPAAPGCKVIGPAPPGRPGVPPRQTIPHRVVCGPVPPFTVPPAGTHIVLGWRLSYTGLSGAPTGADVRLNSPGAAGVLLTALCTTCVAGKFGHVEITTDQATALLDGKGYVVVRTAANPNGEVSGQITRVQAAAARVQKR